MPVSRADQNGVARLRHFWQSRRCFVLLGFCFVLSQLLGLRLESADQTGVWGLSLCLVGAVCLAPAAGWLFWLLYRALGRLSRCQRAQAAAARRMFWIAFAVILLGWLPVYLAYWPGISAYDINTQLGEVLEGSFTNRNPLFHTLIMGGLYLLGQAMGDPAIGYSLFILLQMAVMAGAFASLVSYLWRLELPKWAGIAALALFALFPVHAILSVSDTKDGLFAAFLLLLAIRVHRLSRDPALMKNKRFVCGFFLCAVPTCMLRNNAFPGLILCALIGLWALDKVWRKRFIALMLAALLLYAGSLQGLKAAFHATGGLATEFVSVQSQQMGRVYHLFHETEPDDCAEIKGWLPTVEDYTPYTADPLKTFAIVDKPYRMWGFLKLWGRVGLGHPIVYLDAWLLNTKGYWYLGDTTHTHIYGTGEKLGYLLTGQAAHFGLEGHSVLPKLQALYDRLFAGNAYLRAPIVSVIFSPALWLWLCAFVFTCACHRRDRRTRLVIALVAGSFLMLLMGACVLIRYAYPFVVCMPLLVGSLLKEMQI